MEYSVAIRTLGTAGEKYQQLLNSLKQQTLKPKNIFVYIAEGYPLPKETIGYEKYIYVKKGMVAQRALPYAEVSTEFILFLDDDVYLPPDGVQKLYDTLCIEKADVVSPNVFENHRMPISNKIRMAILGMAMPLVKNKDKFAYKILRSGGFSYNNDPKKSIYRAETNAGPCFFCKKDVFLHIKFHDELWLDETFYALPEDQVMFYKMHQMGYKQLTLFHSGIIHLDAGSTNIGNPQKVLNILYSESRNKLIFWHRFIFLCETNFLLKVWSFFCIVYSYLIRILMMVVKCKKKELKVWLNGIESAITYIKSREYKTLPKIIDYAK